MSDDTARDNIAKTIIEYVHGKEKNRVQDLSSLIPVSSAEPCVVCIDGHFHDLSQYAHNGIVKCESFESKESFALYVSRFHDPNRLFVAAHDNNIKAILDYPKHEGKGVNCKHSASLSLKKDPTYLKIANSVRSHMNQSEFADFIEDILPAITEPAPAELLDNIRSIRAIRNGSWSSDIDRSHNGFKMEISKEAAIKCGAKGVEFPRVLGCFLPVYLGGKHYSVKLRLNVKADEGKITFSFDFSNKDILLHEAKLDEVAAVNGCLAYYGVETHIHI